jgi:glycosyltransferase involved in cell wall biosynthesis
MHVVHPGLNLTGHGGPRAARTISPLTIGYFARICPEKGFHNLVEAFIALRRRPGVPPVRLKASGWLGENQLAFYHKQVDKLAAAGLAGEFEHRECPSHAEKVSFLQSVDVFSVPTDYHEPKGLYVLEAWANGVPVVQPGHGSFPELITATGGGLLVEPGNAAALVDALLTLLQDHEMRDRLGRSGEAAVRSRFTAEVMARETVALLERLIGPREPAQPAETNRTLQADTLYPEKSEAAS